MFTKQSRLTLLSLPVVLSLLVVSVAVACKGSGVWSPAQKIDEVAGNSTELNTPSLDGCPVLSPDGRSLYMASDRPGGHGKLDIWVAHRAGKHGPFGPPQNLPAPINSAEDDFCPTPLTGNRLLFVSRRVVDGSCGLGDIYESRQQGQGWREPRHLACAPEGPNSALDEQGPSLIEVRGVEKLFFSRSTPTVPGDIFVSRDFGPARPVDEVNSPGNDIQPNVRKDGRELVFSSNRAGGAGGQDIWSATRASIDQPWSTAVNLGAGVNTAFGESRPSLSNDAAQLLFGRAGPVGTGEGGTGAADVYVTTRQRNP